MRKFYFLFITCIILLFSCTPESVENIVKDSEEVIDDPIKEEVEDENVVYFTFNSRQHHQDSENWILIHDQDGNLIDFQQFEFRDRIVFEKPKSLLDSIEYLNMTLSNHRVSQDAIRGHSIITYTGLNKGDEWDNIPNPEFYNEDKQSSQYSLSLNNIPGIDRYLLSSLNYDEFAEYPNQNVDKYDKTDITLNDYDKYLLSFTDFDKIQKYLFIETNPADPEILIDYGDFKNYNVIIETNLPQNSYFFYNTRCFEDSEFKRGFSMSNYNSYDSPTISRIGYIDGYESYSTLFGISMADYRYYYTKYGTKPTSINIPNKPVLNVSNTSLKNFSYNTVFDYQWRRSNWNFNNYNDQDSNQLINIFWSVYAEANNTELIIGEIPAEILEKYPSLSIEKIDYYSTDLYYSSAEHINSGNYKYYIEDNPRYSNNVLPFQWEYITILNEDRLDEN